VIVMMALGAFLESGHDKIDMNDKDDGADPAEGTK
jgi:hypothetical protein